MAAQRPGWLEDPDDPTQLRYFDGSKWTEHTASPDAKPSKPPSARAGAAVDLGALPPPTQPDTSGTNDPGWKTDPHNASRIRYWNGRKWTGYTADPSGPRPQIPAAHLTASPTLWERFQGVSRLERIGLAALAVVGIVGIVVAIAVSSSTDVNTGGNRSGGNVTLSEAFCNDVKAGASPAQMYASVPDRWDDLRDFAGNAYGMMAISCPEELEGWRWFFEEWDVNIDA